MNVLSTCLCVYQCMPNASKGQKRVLGPLELVVQMVVSHDVGVGNRP